MFRRIARIPRAPVTRFSVPNVAARSYATGPRQEAPKFRYILGLAVLGFAGFAYGVNTIEKKAPKDLTEEELAASIAKSRNYKKAAFAPGQVSVIFVLGGPGAGKGTQCDNLVRDYGFVHLSAGDLLRAEQKREGSKYGDLIASCIKEGKIVPQEVTLALLEQAMRESLKSGKSSRFLIDGFPRKMDQAVKFEEDIAVSKMTLFFDCPESVMLERLLKRGETSGRTDDNIESIKKRFRTFIDTSMPVVNYFDKAGKVVKVSCNDTKENVYNQVKAALKQRGVE